MEWSQSETIALSRARCPNCMGAGMWKGQPCTCVTRAMFQACYQRFRRCTDWGWATRVTVDLSRLGSGTGKRAPRRAVRQATDQMYIADFYLISKRTLSEADWEFFNRVFLLGADWDLLQRMGKTSMTKATHGKNCRRIEEILGRVFRETEPYPLFPLDEYFGARPPGSTKVTAFPGTKPARYQPLRPPLAA